MRNLRIGTRILFGFGVVLGLTILVGAYALFQLAAERKFSTDMNNRDYYVLDALRQLSRTEDRMRATRELALINTILRRDRLGGEDPSAVESEWRQNRDQNLKTLTDLESALSGYATSSLTQRRSFEWRSIRDAARRSLDALRALAPEVEKQFARMNRAEVAEVVAGMPAVDALRRDYEAKLAEAQRLTEGQIEIGRAEIDSYYDRTRSSVMLGLALAVIAGILSSISIQRSITRPLDALMKVVARVGQGDLTEQVTLASRDEIGEFARTLNQTIAGLRQVAGQTRSAAENLNAATAEILASTQQQAAGTAEQAAAVQQANATMAEISHSGAQISLRAKEVATAAEATSSATAAGLQAVQNTTTTMEGIREQAEAVAENVIALSEKTQAIGEIIATVNDIAEQSHLLALNASIEAAAAGEHGRSFAVVASEMKNLADQSKQATVQVRSILGDIQKSITNSVMLTEEAVKRIESGRQQADVSDRTIHSLTDSVQESVQAFQQIVAGSSQQQIGFEQVTQAFRSIGVAAEQTAANTRQSERAAANLNALAQQLRSAVERYRI
jgi:methyl-accepting chemotaxis protein